MSVARQTYDESGKEERRMGIQDRLCFQFHDENPPGAAAEALIRIFAEMNLQKAENALKSAGRSEENHSRE